MVPCAVSVGLQCQRINNCQAHSQYDHSPPVLQPLMSMQIQYANVSAANGNEECQQHMVEDCWAFEAEFVDNIEWEKKAWVREGLPSGS